MTTAEWRGDDLWIFWYGARATSPSAYWRNFRVIFSGQQEDFSRRYNEKPTAEIALEAIVNWQNADWY